MKKFVLVLALLFVLGCTSEDEAMRILSSQGFKNIQFTGYSVFSCSQDDTFHTGFKAQTQTGAWVEGTVCSGILKGATVRFN